MEKNALLQEIIACMAENGGYSQTELERFCTTFFESIEAGLLADKYVKIKGFGTFKLINVSERESINVNTGERIQISGHAKASFIPDNDLKDLINSPFSHFQTVVINDETDLEEMASVADADIMDMESGWGDEETVDEQSPVVGLREDETPEEESLPSFPEGDVEDMKQQKMDMITQSEVSSQETPDPSENSASLQREHSANSIPHLDKSACADGAVSSEGTTSSSISAASVVSDKNSSDDNDTIQKSAVELPCTESADKTICHQSAGNNAECESGKADQEGNYYSSMSHTTGKPYPFRYVLKVKRAMQRPNWWKVIAIFLFVFILLTLSYFAGYYKVFCPPCEEENKVSLTEQNNMRNPEAASSGVTAVGKDSAQVIQGEKKDSVAVVLSESAMAKKKVEVIQKDSVAKEQKPVTYSIKKKYSISGLLTIHKVRPNETLSIIARRIYGYKEFSKYIVQYNNISNPDNIVVGTALKIPALKEE